MAYAVALKYIQNGDLFSIEFIIEELWNVENSAFFASCASRRMFVVATRKHEAQQRLETTDFPFRFIRYTSSLQVEGVSVEILKKHHWFWI